MRFLMDGCDVDLIAVDSEGMDATMHVGNYLSLALSLAAEHVGRVVSEQDASDLAFDAEGLRDGLAKDARAVYETLRDNGCYPWLKEGSV